MKKIFTIIFLNLCVLTFANAQDDIRGKVSDLETGKPLEGAIIRVKGKVIGTISNEEGLFSLNTKLPAVLQIGMIGYTEQEIRVNANNEIQVALAVDNQNLDQVVVSASRVKESILTSPVTVEKMDELQIKRSPAANFYDALNNLKGLDMVTSSLTYKRINTRGFNDTSNSRFLQMVDGVDNQSAGLGFAMGNLFGPHDIDIASVELVPGAASALYGPVAFNGMLQMYTKNPFDYQGLSVQTKVAMNHLNDGTGLGAKPMGDFAVRYAKAFNNRFAFKVNASYLGGTDWYANNYSDIDPNTPVNQRGPNNPGKNQLNVYGDEVAQTIDGIGRVSRTGYEEKDLVNYNVYSLKLNGALHYRINDKLEAIYQANYSQGVAQYTGSSRFVINGFRLMQHRVELKGANFFVRAYTSRENSEDSYNSRSLGLLINKTWVKDLNGNTVDPSQADATWFQRYTQAFYGNINGVGGNDHTAARAFADEGRLLPGTKAFDEAKDQLIHTQGLQGAGIFSKCGLMHIGGVYDLSSQIGFMGLQVGGNYRKYFLNTQGTLFDDKGKNLTNEEYGTFVQASKNLLSEKLKLTASVRYDKNMNFTGRFTPRASAVFSPNDRHHFRASYQTGFRNPTIGDQYIKLNVGPIIILGGVPVNSEGLSAYPNSFTAASVGQFASSFGAEVAQGVPFPQAVANNKDKLQKSNVPYIKPEKVKSIELGYKTLLTQNLFVDLNYFISQYTDFIINTVVISPNSSVLDTEGNINFEAASDILSGNTQAYQLYTNASDKVSIQGASMGLSYNLPKHYKLAGNATWTQFNLQNADPSNIPAFNTPTWKTNLTFGNPKLTDHIGFNLAWHWQNAFDWYGTFNGLNPGRIDAYSLLDAQISYHIPQIKTTIKLGGSNITNKYVIQAFGSPAVGGLYYISLNFN
ncbi:TonB-dependent receptor [Marinilongibacter aquaticus]|uniref:TonB-dependent receptor n=1 Tax=Marinilongibacter aquaticus TaxID=2975157 RepID=UPI0021BD44A7|nr:TonB-dependent receptor [Marinilongibacter aquaticus]UBM58185.1 TonB-dependent receptor [Marinilongibacter aquaticus]